MAKTTITMTRLRHKPRESKRRTANLDAVGGVSALDLFETFCGTAHVSHFIDRNRAKFLTLEGSARHGRLVLAHVESGTFGNPGTIREISNNKIRFRKNSEQVSATPTRIALFVPPGAAEGLFFVEREGGFGDGLRVLNFFKDALLRHFEDSFFPTERVVYKDAWLEDAVLSRVEVRYKSWKPSMSGGGEADGVPHIAEQRRELRPIGSNSFNSKFKQRTLDRQISLSKLLGFEEKEETEEIVELTLDGRTKSFALGSHKTPPVSVLLTADSAPRLSDEDFVYQLYREAEELYSLDDKTWDTSWELDDGKDKADVEWQHIYAEPKPGSTYDTSNSGQSAPE